MRILADQNVPASLVAALRTTGHDVSYIEEISPGVPDTQVLRLADEERRLLITFDVEFASDVWRRRPHPNCGMMLLRLPAAKPEPKSLRFRVLG